MSDESKTVRVGPSFLSLLALLFIGLKLTGFIDWSWWWVTAPLWGGMALFLIFILGIFSTAALIAVFGKK